MDSKQTAAAVAAARTTASALGLAADDAVVLHNSNRLAVRLLPCAVLARVGPADTNGANLGFELEVARQLAEVGAPCGGPEPGVEPRVYERDGFAITFSTYFEPVPAEVTPADFAHALHRLHAGLRQVDIATPHFTDRIAEAQEIVGDPALSPELTAPDRTVLVTSLRELRSSILSRGAPEQLLHGEPHPGNLLNTKRGPLFIDFQTACRGPVEFDIAHAPEEVGPLYPGADEELIAEGRLLVLAMVAAWRWDRNDQFPDGRAMGLDFVAQLRAAGRFGFRES